MSEFDELDEMLADVDNLVVEEQISANIMHIGSSKTFEIIKRRLKDYSGIDLIFVNKVKDAIQLLLQNIFALVVIENIPEFDMITATRVVRVNHPLARIIVISRYKNSALIAELINNGSVNGFLHLRKMSKNVLHQLITEQLAKHEIDKMIVKYISNPPKLSKASYLLLDPTLPFGNENIPVKYVGIMISHESVPRYSYFFEDLLAKDEILFSGYLSGISLLGMQLFDSKEPIKEINFAGISVVMRFEGKFHFSFLVRNLSSPNAEVTEKLIDNVVNSLLDQVGVELASHKIIHGKALEKVETILNDLVEANQFATQIIPDMIQYNEYIMLYGLQKKRLHTIMKYLERKFNFKVLVSDSRDMCLEELNTNEYDILFIESEIEDGDSIHFAEYAKDISPHLQIIYEARDMRKTDLLIRALNSTYIDQVVSYNHPMKRINSTIHMALNKAIEIKQQSRMGIQSANDQVVVAKSMIRGDKNKYLAESVPELHGIIITINDQLVYAFQPRRANLITHHHEMIGGIVAALNSIGTEALGTKEIGSVEMGGAHILVTHKDQYHIGFLVDNLQPNTSVVLEKEFKEFTEKLYNIIMKYNSPDTRNPKLARESEHFDALFRERYEN